MSGNTYQKHVNVTADTSGLDDLIAKAKQADAQIQKLQEDITKAARAAMFGPSQANNPSVGFKTFSELAPNLPQMQGADKDLDALVRQLVERETELINQIKNGGTGGGSGSGGSGGSGGGKAAKDDSDKAEEKASRRKQLTFLEQLAQNVQKARPLSYGNMVDALSGNVGPLRGSMVNAVLNTLTNTGSRRGVGVGRLGSLSQQVDPAAVGTGTANTGAAVGEDVAAADAKLIGGGAAGGVFDALSGVVGKLVPVLGAVLGLGAAVEAVRNEQTYARRAQTDLAVNMGDITTGKQAQGAYGDLLGIANGYSYTPDVAESVAKILGQAGVKEGNLHGAANLAMGMGRMTNSDPNSWAEITGQLITMGNQSTEAISSMFQELIQQAKATHIPLNRVVQDLKDLGPAGAGISVAGVNGMAAVQQLVGPGVQAGQLVNPMMNMTGSNLFALSALSGMPISSVVNAQSNPATTFDMGLKIFQNLLGKKARPTGTDIGTAEVLNQGLGLFNTSSMTPAQQFQFFKNLYQGKNGEAEALATKIGKGESIDSFTQFKAEARAAGQDLTTDAEKVGAAWADTMRSMANSTTTMDLYGQSVKDANDQLRFFTNYMKLINGAVAPGSPNDPFALNPNNDPNNPRNTDNTNILPWLTSMMPKSTYGNVPGMTTTAPIYSADKYPGLVPKGLTALKINSDYSHENVPVSQSVYTALQKASQATGVPFSLLLSQAARESGLDPNAGFGGLGQFTPDTATFVRDRAPKSLGLSNFNPANLQQNATAMAWYDTYLLSKFHDVADALGHYNQGPDPSRPLSNAAINYETSILGAERINRERLDHYVHVVITDTNGNKMTQAPPVQLHHHRQAKGTPATHPSKHRNTTPPGRGHRYA